MEPKYSDKYVESGKNRLVAVIALPKTGSTWLQCLIADSLGLDLYHSSDKTVYREPKVVKLHESYSIAKKRDDIICAVYLMRDVRDSIVSYYFYQQTEFFKSNIDSTIDHKNIENFYFDYFIKTKIHEQEWLHHAAKYETMGFPFMKYEDLWDNTAGELECLFSKWGKHVPSSRIEWAVEKNQIDRLKKTGVTIKNWHHLTSPFFRKGGYGNYLEILPPHIVKDINRRFKRVLKHWGYPLEPS